MNQNEVNILASKSLLFRATQSSKQSQAYMLIDTAKLLDDSIDTDSLKKDWLENWIIRNESRKSNPFLNVTL